MRLYPRTKRGHQTVLQWMTPAIALVTLIYGFTLMFTAVTPSSPTDSQPYVATRLLTRLENLAVELDSLKESLDSRPQLQGDTSASGHMADLKPLQDSLRILSGNVRLLNDAITPQSMTEIVTLQRLGDRYEQLMQSNKDLKSDIEKHQLASERALRDHAASIDSELDRFTPMIYGMLGTIVLIVIQNFMVQRRKEPDTRGKNESTE